MTYSIGLAGGQGGEWRACGGLSVDPEMDAAGYCASIRKMTAYLQKFLLAPAGQRMDAMSSCQLGNQIIIGHN
jgi:hypothetical protein